MATVMTHQRMFERHLQGLLETERTLSAESRRVECGLATVRRQIAVERQALAAASGSSGTVFPAARQAPQEQCGRWMSRGRASRGLK